jgi:hypothetical protein
MSNQLDVPPWTCWEAFRNGKPERQCSYQDCMDQYQLLERKFLQKINLKAFGLRISKVCEYLTTGKIDGLKI